MNHTPSPWTAPQLLQTSSGFWQACALHAAVKLDIFTSLANDGPADAQALADRLSTDTRGMTGLLNAIAAMGLLTKDGDTFTNTPETADFLCAGSDKYLGHIIKHHHYLVGPWSRLDQAVQTGAPVRDPDRKPDPDQLESFLMGMFDMGMQMAPRVAEQVDLAGRTHLLDLGGGPGTYAIHFCLANPDLKATVFDRPGTRPFAEQTIARFDLSDRISFQPGDFTADKPGREYDCAWLSHVLHSQPPDECAFMAASVHGALKPGGRIFIQDFILDDTMDRPLFPALFALNMLAGTPGGQSYSESQIKDLLITAGFKDVQRLPYEGPNGAGIIMGIVGGE